MIQVAATGIDRVVDSEVHRLQQQLPTFTDARIDKTAVGFPIDYFASYIRHINSQFTDLIII
jgi:hypothetical protein